MEIIIQNAVHPAHRGTYLPSTTNTTNATTTSTTTSVTPLLYWTTHPSTDKSPIAAVQADEPVTQTESKIIHG